MLKPLQEKYELVKEVRGRGLLIGVQLGEPTSAYLRQAWTMMHKINQATLRGWGARPTPKRSASVFSRQYLDGYPLGPLFLALPSIVASVIYSYEFSGFFATFNLPTFSPRLYTRALEVTPNRVNAYMEKRQREGAVPATINREVEGLQRALPSRGS